MSTQPSRIIRHRKPSTLFDAVAAKLRQGALPEAALGWNVYSGESFMGFIPAPDLDGKLAAITDDLADEIEAA